MRPRTLLIPAVCVLLSGLLAGCGGGSSSSTTGGAPDAADAAALARYVAAADAVCKSENDRLAAPAAKLEAAMLSAQKSGELAGAAGGLKTFQAAVREGLARLEAVEPPAAANGQVEAIIATQTDQVELFGELARAFEAEDRTAAQKVETRLANSKKRYGRQTAKLGFKVCGVRSR
jgi:hypothetical protein